MAKIPHLFKNAWNWKRGFIKRVGSSPTSNAVHYIPRHPVKKSPLPHLSELFTIVAESNLLIHPCLNPGHPFLNDLCTILLCFHQHNFAFSSVLRRHSYSYIRWDRQGFTCFQPYWSKQLICRVSFLLAFSGANLLPVHAQC